MNTFEMNNNPTANSNWFPAYIGTADAARAGYMRLIPLADGKKLTVTLVETDEVIPCEGMISVAIDLYTVPGTKPDIHHVVNAPDIETARDGAFGTLLQKAAELALDYHIIEHALITYLTTIGGDPNGKNDGRNDDN